MTTRPEDWARVKAIFDASLDVESAGRAAYLATACGDDADLRRRVEALLASYESADSFLETPAAHGLGGLGAPADDLVGRTVGGYRVVSRLGAGGMGEVYRARDARLNRDVALKILPEAFASDPDRLARFTREAQTLAALNHPNIAAIYGIEESPDVRALVMELVDGEELSTHIARGPMPIEEVLPIVRQMADALEAAHDQGIIHRDLKPANIKVKPDGTVKVLDFGLAKLVAGDSALGTGSHPMNSPTMNSPAMTVSGVILGTAAYMSPEQARGKTVDKRADIWSFGVVLYEMLTGQRAFKGDDVTETLASVMRDTLPFDALPASTPPRLRRILERCLERDPKARLRDIGEARVELTKIAAGDTDLSVASGIAAMSGRRTTWWRGPLGLVAATACGVLVTFGAIMVLRSVDRERPMPVYAFIDTPADYVLGEDDATFSLPIRTPMVFTADGRSLVFLAARAGKPQLFQRPLDRPDARPIAGTGEARVPFVSPDGKWVGFWSANEIRKAPMSGGPAVTVCSLRASQGPYGAAWGTGDVIVFGDEASGRIMRVPAGGGTPAPVTAQPPTGRRHVAPFFFPDGKRILFSDVARRDAADSRLMVQSLDGGDARLVIAPGVDGRLLSSGQLVFLRLGTLMTAPFDTARGETTGAAVVAIGDVMQSAHRARIGADNPAAGMFAVSSLGTLAFVRGPLIGPRESRLIWATRDGRTSSAEPASGAPAGSRVLSRIAPDGSRAIVAVATPIRSEMWLADWTRDTWTLCGNCYSDVGVGVWSPDGKRLLIGRNDTLVAYALDGSAPDVVMVREGGRMLVPSSWRADGRIVYQSSPDLANFEIKLLEPGGHTGRVVVPLGTGWRPEVSPDGRWLAYDTKQIATGEVIMQAFPGPGARAQVSAGGGTNPLWAPDGRTLYYLRRTTEPADDVVVAVDIAASPGLTPGKSRELFRRGQFACNNTRCYDISADGQRFLLYDRTAVPRTSITRMDLVLNWSATLPGGR